MADEDLNACLVLHWPLECFNSLALASSLSLPLSLLSSSSLLTSWFFRGEGGINPFPSFYISLFMKSYALLISLKHWSNFGSKKKIMRINRFLFGSIQSTVDINLTYCRGEIYEIMIIWVLHHYFTRLFRDESKKMSIPKMNLKWFNIAWHNITWR